MTVVTSHAVKQHDGNGFDQVFEVDFQFLDHIDLVVTVIGVAGTETVQTIGAHYNVTGGKNALGQPDIGEILIAIPPASGEKLRIERITVPIQPLDLRLASNFSPSAIEASLDRSLLLDQEANLTAARSAQVSMTSFLAGDSSDMPAAVSQAYLGWNEDGTALQSEGGLPWLVDWVTATPYEVNDLVRSASSSWICTADHTSDAATEPGIGGSFDTVWDLLVSEGDVGAVGIDAGFPYNFDTSTAMADPGTGDLRLNNAALASVTQLAIHYTNALGVAIGALIQTWDDSDSNTTRAFLLIRDSSAPQNFAIYSISAALTNNGTWAQIPVAHVQSSGTLSGTIGVQWMRVGNRGPAGAGTGDLLAANNLSDVANLVTSFTNIKQPASTSATGVAELATDAEAQAKSDTVRVLTPSNLAALGATETLAGLVERATDTEAGQGTDTTRYFSPAQVHEAQVDVASAGTTNIGAAASNFVRITGVTTITAFDTVAAGVWRTIRFEGALTLTYNATSMILPSLASIITAANDCCLARSLGSGNWLVLWYQKANGQPLASGVANAAPSRPQGRLTLTASTPVMTSNAAGQTTVRYTPYLGRHVPLFNGSAFVMTDTGGELTQATTDTTKSPAAVTTHKNYDVFVWSDGGTMRATRGPAWSTDSSRGTGAGTTELTRVQGFFLNAVDITNGPAASRGTYVGTIRSDASSQINWIFGAIGAGGTQAVLGVWNMYNRVKVETLVGDSTDTWTYHSTTIRSANNSAANRINFLMGLAEDSYQVDMSWRTLFGTTGGTSPSFTYAIMGIGLDSTSALASGQRLTGGPPDNGNGLETREATVYRKDLGWHFAQALEAASNTSLGQPANFFGDSGAVNRQSGIAFRGYF